MTLPIEFDARSNVATLGGESLVFHCHHYNCALQKVIEEGMGAAAGDLLQCAGQEVAREQMQRLPPGRDTADTLARSSALFAELGFGQWDLGGVVKGSGTAVLKASHYGLGWVSKYGERASACCHFPAGYLAGAIAVAYGLAPERVRVKETHCCAMGAEHCVFATEVF